MFESLSLAILPKQAALLLSLIFLLPIREPLRCRQKALLSVSIARLILEPLACRTLRIRGMPCLKFRGLPIHQHRK